MEQERFEKGRDLDTLDKECNFAPQTITNPDPEAKQRQPRNFEQCVADQYEYLNKINEKA